MKPKLPERGEPIQSPHGSNWGIMRHSVRCGARDNEEFPGAGPQVVWEDQ